MKLSSALSVLTLLLAPAAAGAALPAASGGPLQDDFVARFKQAQKIGAKDEMNRLVRLHQEAATNRIFEVCSILYEGHQDDLVLEKEALTKSWHTVYKNSYPDKVSEFFASFTPEAKEARDKLSKEHDVAYRKIREAEKAGDQEQIAALGAQMKTIAEGFAAVGDQYHASQSFWMYANANDQDLRKEQADFKAALEGYQKSAEAREKFDLKDTPYAQIKERAAALEHALSSGATPGEGGAGGAPGEPGEPGAAPAASLGALLTTTFEVVPDIELYRRPIYAGDAVFAMWNSLSFRGKGTSTKFNAMAESPTIMRVASSKVTVDADRDGKGEGEADVAIPLTGKLTPIQITLGAGSTKREWAFLTAVGGQQDTYNGIQFNLAPSDDYMTIYIAPAASLVTTIGGTQVRILDDNLDGSYGSLPLTFGFAGLAESYFQPEIDTVVVGESKLGVPWSEYLDVGGAWYRLQSTMAGNEIRAAPVPELATGTLKLELKGVPVDWLLVRGAAKTAYENCYYELSASATGVQVPAGTYELFAGQVGAGKKAQKAKALILPSKSTRDWTVGAGETVTIELGEPFSFDFASHEDATSLTVVGDSVVVTGKAQETYQRLWNCVVRPEVLTREAGKKRGSKGDSMKGPGTMEEVNEKGFQYAWFPFDFVMEKKVEGELEVQLFEKKNKLFGTIESDWK